MWFGIPGRPLLGDHRAQQSAKKWWFSLSLIQSGRAPPLCQARPSLTGHERLFRSEPSRASAYGSICTGAFPLGHAGLLDGHRVTTHWQNAQKLAVRRNIAYRELEARLRAMGINDNEKNLSTKISRGRFAASFFFNAWPRSAASPSD